MLSPVLLAIRGLAHGASPGAVVERRSRQMVRARPAAILAKPANARLPVPSPVYAPGDFSINLNTAHALGIDVPRAANLQRRAPRRPLR